MTKPVMKRRRDITVRPPAQRRGESSPAEATVAGETRERRPKPDGQELADQRTWLRKALGGSRRDCPGRQENGAQGSRESGPPEGRYKANLAVPAPRPRRPGPEEGGRVRYYLGVDWADQTHAVWVVDESGRKITAREVAHTAEGLGEWGRELNEWRAQGIALWASIERPDGRVVDFLLDHGVVVYPVNPKALDRARDRFRQSGAKSDPFDARVLADFLRTDHPHLQALQPSSDAALTALTARQWQRWARGRRLSEARIGDLWAVLQQPQLPVPAHVVRAKARLMQRLVEQLTPVVVAVVQY